MEAGAAQNHFLLGLLPTVLLARFPLHPRAEFDANLNSLFYI